MVAAERARPYLTTAEQSENATDFINAVYVDVSIYMDSHDNNDNIRAQELCESRGGRPGPLPVPDSPCGLCGH